MCALFLPVIMEDWLKILGCGSSGFTEVAFESGKEPPSEPPLFFLPHHCANLPQHKIQNRCLDPVWFGSTVATDVWSAYSSLYAGIKWNICFSRENSTACEFLHS